MSLIVLTTPASAELKPGVKLDKSNCQEAKGLLPDVVLEQFCAGQYTADIVEVKDDAFQYSKKFRAGSEANAGKYYVTDNGYMYETATKTWPPDDATPCVLGAGRGRASAQGELL